MLEGSKTFSVIPPASYLEIRLLLAVKAKGVHEYYIWRKKVILKGQVPHQYYARGKKVIFKRHLTP